MAILDFLFKAVGTVTTPVVDYLKRRAELKAEAQAQQRAIQAALANRQIDLITQGLTADMNWEMEFARQAQSSWKDEYTLIVTSVPAILSFIRTPWLDGPAIVSQGFAALGTTPLWYQIIFGTMFCATVGVRWWRRSQSDT